MRFIIAACALVCASTATRAEEPTTRLLWGDVHVHSNRSFDAYLMSNKTGDADAIYRFAKGETVANPYSGQPERLRTPLDFMAVTDHAEYLGLPYEVLAIFRSGRETTRAVADLTALVRAGKNKEAYDQFLRAADSPTLAAGLDDLTAAATAWGYNAEAADRHYEPGRFTALVGWEWTSKANGAVLHRVVLSTADAPTAKTFRPYSSLYTKDPAMLWSFLERTKAATRADFVAIPHNSNLSNGRMFAPTRFNGDFLNAAAAIRRMNWETVAEVMQIKGASETSPALSPGDEFAAFEFLRRSDTPPPSRADYVRGALLTGIEEEQRIGVNPFKLGMIGSTDSHSGVPSAEEDNFTGAFAYDSAYENKDYELDGNNGKNVSAGALAAVWARNNTREEIISAIRRREVYASSGPRLALRFFGGYDFDAADAQAPDIAAVGYAKGVPMGADLVRAADWRAPSFLIGATRDPLGANLDRIQVVKGWLDPSNRAREKVFNVALAGERTLRLGGTPSPVGDTVDRETATYANTIGAPALSVVWTDPEFNPRARAFYYVRVLQIPTPRHSLYEAVAHGDRAPDNLPEVIQERAMSSPIWYAP
ncbi:MAG: DUF3604 domain-containing protein [Parvularculaceae bacterium]